MGGPIRATVSFTKKAASRPKRSEEDINTASLVLKREIKL